MYYNDSGRNAHETGSDPGMILFESPQRPQSGKKEKGTVPFPRRDSPFFLPYTILIGPVGAFGLMGVSITAYNDNL